VQRDAAWQRGYETWCPEKNVEHASQGLFGSTAEYELHHDWIPGSGERCYHGAFLGEVQPRGRTGVQRGAGVYGSEQQLES
jgi:hypothetical protein